MIFGTSTPLWWQASRLTTGSSHPQQLGQRPSIGLASASAAPKLHVPVPPWVTAAAWLATIALVAILVWLGYRRWRRHRPPKITDREASMRRWVAWVAARWAWDARNLGLVLVDDTTRHRREFWTGQTLPPVVRIPRPVSSPRPTVCGPGSPPCPAWAWTR